MAGRPRRPRTLSNVSVLFVTATGTGVGKTFVTAALIAKLKTEGRTVCALKPVATGFDAQRPEESDGAILLAALEMPIDSRTLDDVTPWRFAAPLSPDMAAAREGRCIDFDELVAFCRRPRDADVTLIEGIGGVMVPLDEQHTVLDWIAALSVPAVVVAGSYLGSLSHTLTALSVLDARGCRAAGIVVNESAEQPVPAAETAACLRRFAAPTPVAVVRRHENPSAAAHSHSQELGRLVGGLR